MGTGPGRAATGSVENNGSAEASSGNGHALEGGMSAGPRLGVERLSNFGNPKKVNLKELREVMKCLNFSRCTPFPPCPQSEKAQRAEKDKKLGTSAVQRSREGRRFATGFPRLCRDS